MGVTKAFAIILLLAASGCTHLQPVQGGTATIEFERQEDNGSVNIVPCTLILSDNQKITLNGGDRAILSVAPGNFYVTAFSVDPYAPKSGAKAWHSPPTGFQVTDGETLQVFVDPASSGSTYTGGWTIQASSTQAYLPGIQEFLQGYVDAESTNDVDYFFVTPVRIDGKEKFAYAYWMTGNSIIILDLPISKLEDYSWYTGKARIDLATDVVPTPDDIAGSDYLVNVAWVENIIRDSLDAGTRFVIRKKQTSNTAEQTASSPSVSTDK